MQPHHRAIVAASAYAVIAGRKVVGLYDHAAQRHLRIAAECRGDRVQAFDGDRSAGFGGTLPELYDEADRLFISLETDGTGAEGYDRGSGSFYTARLGDRMVQLYDHGEGAWFAFSIREDGDASDGA
jgi:hypothetical protein